MKILVVGNGGREHALLRKLREDAPGAEFYITRGNGGTAGLATPLPLDPSDVPALATWAELNNVALCVCGPEGPLAQGIAEQFAQHGVPLFGPSLGAANIEASKAYAKRLMKKAGVPTAAFGVFTDVERATSFIREHGAPIVVKASGLAAGKGAVVCDTVEEALDTARAMLAGGVLGAAGSEIVIEEFMAGEELSLFALCDGVDAIPMLPAQDHKRIGEGDTGPNTGGMGAYAPVSIGTPDLIERVRREILLPVLAAMRDDGHPFRGLLYAGLMLTKDGPKVIEFNARFGDPETQVVLPMLASSLLDPMLAIASGGSIRGAELTWREGAALTTVLAAGGYPGTIEKGHEIHVPDDVASADDVIVFHAGTVIRDGRLLTAGGRVLAVTGLGPDLETAARRSRDAAARITFEGRQYRGDIGWRELARRASPAQS
ncbi:MAG TPA: phosphoribosylamine--glycine ligase [Longimicrobiales bacterium]|nr:phosphoribosylamine--glycine ligase [Longimicrobiales bacterium]